MKVLHQIAGDSASRAGADVSDLWEMIGQAASCRIAQTGALLQRWPIYCIGGC